MGRQQVLVQLDAELLSVLDERAAAEGVSRSEVLRRVTRAALADDVEGRLDKAIAEGYRRVPAEKPDTAVAAQAIVSIEAEPW